MKLPNGYGSVYKLPGNRRKPWAARIVASRSESPDGTSPDGTPRFKYKYLGYYETKEKALIALAQFNAHPYNTDANKVTFGDVFEMWSAEHFPKVSHSNVNGYNAVYNLCAPSVRCGSMTFAKCICKTPLTLAARIIRRSES